MQARPDPTVGCEAPLPAPRTLVGPCGVGGPASAAIVAFQASLPSPRPPSVSHNLAPGRSPASVSLSSASVALVSLRAPCQPWVASRRLVAIVLKAGLLEELLRIGHRTGCLVPDPPAPRHCPPSSPQTPTGPPRAAAH